MDQRVQYFNAADFDQGARQQCPGDTSPSNQFSQSLPSISKQQELLQQRLSNALAKSMEDVTDDTPHLVQSRRPGPRTRLFPDEEREQKQYSDENDPEMLRVDELQQGGAANSNQVPVDLAQDEDHADNMHSNSTVEAALVALARARGNSSRSLTSSGREVPVGREDSGISTMLSSGPLSARTETRPGAAGVSTDDLKVTDLFSPTQSQNSFASSSRTMNRDTGPLDDISKDILGAKGIKSHAPVHEDQTGASSMVTVPTLMYQPLQQTKQSQAVQKSIKLLQGQNATLNTSDKENVNPTVQFDETVEGYSPDFKWNKIGQHGQEVESPRLDLSSIPSAETTPVIGQARKHVHGTELGRGGPQLQPVVEAVTPPSARSANTSQMDSDDISSVERLRLYLQNMLQSTADNIPNKAMYDQTESVGHLMMDQMFPNLSADLSYTFQSAGSFSMPKEKENANKFSDALDLAAYGSHQQKVVQSSVSLMAENQTLREKLEKQTYRRKHCEHQVKQLQEKILELQQQLAVAISTERRKDMAIEQLNQVLGTAVENWKKEQANKQQKIQQLQKERSEYKTAFEQHQNALEESQQKLKHMTLTLSNERQRAAQNDRDRISQMKQQEELSRQMSSQLQHEREHSHQLAMELDRAARERDRLRLQQQELQQSQEEERDTWEEKERDYLQKIEEITDNHLKALQQEQAKATAKELMVQETQAALAAAQKQLQELEMRLDTVQREKESVKVEFGLAEARFESSRRKLEADLKAEAERQLAERAEEAHQRQGEAEARLREQHRKQVFELNQRHACEMEEQLQQYHEDLKRKDAHLKEQVDMYEQRLNEARAEIDALKNQNKRLEGYRLDITNKLQGMMQSLCTESFQLLRVGTKAPEYSASEQLQMTATTETVNRAWSPAVPSYTQTSSAVVSTTTALAGGLRVSTGGQQESLLLDQSQVYMDPPVQLVPAPVDHVNPSHAAHFISHQFASNPGVLQQSQALQQVHTQQQEHPPSAFHPVNKHQQSVLSHSFQPIGQGTSETHSFNSLQADLLNQMRNLNQTADFPAMKARLTSLAQMAQGSNRQSQNSSLNTSNLSSSSQTSGQVQDATAIFRANQLFQQGQQLSACSAQGQYSRQVPTSATRGPDITIHQPTVMQDDQAMHTAVPQQTFRTGIETAELFSSLLPDQSMVSETDFRNHRLSVSTTVGHEDHTGFSMAPTDDSLAATMQENMRLSSMDYSQLSDKMEEHEARQRELQHYLHMLLNRSPSNPAEFEDSLNESARSHHSGEGKSVLGETAIGSSAFSKVAVSGSGIADRSTPNIPPQPVEGLSPQQVGEIARLLQTYRGSELGQGQDPPIEQLLSVMNSLSNTPEKPTRDPGAGQSEPPLKPPQASKDGPKARRNLGLTYQTNVSMPESKQSVGTAQVKGSKADSQNQPGARRPAGPAQPVRKVTGGQSSSSKAAPQKKPERKVASKASNKSTAQVWK